MEPSQATTCILDTHIAPESVVKDELDDGDLFQENDSDDGGVYKPRPQLPPPNVHMRSLGSLIKELESGVINVDPEYQREVVWTADRMTGLINSLMENYYIPPIILNKKKSTASDGSKARDTLVCVDGKQRLSSVRAFVKGMIPCHDHRGEKWWFCETPGVRLRRKILPEETQKMFLEKDFVAFQFAGLTLVQEEDLFARVQMGMQLTAAEKMRAQGGPWQELAKLFVDDFPVVYSLMKDRARAKDFQLTLACFSQIMEVMHPTASNGIPILKTNYSALPRLLRNTGAVDDAIKSHLASVWNTLKHLIEQDPATFTNADKHLGGVQTFAPIEMVAVTVLISKYSETRNHQLLLGDITALREVLREHFKDIRLNLPTWKFVWEFIDDLEAIRGVVDGSTVNRNPTKQPSKSDASSATATVSVASSTPIVQRGKATKAKPVAAVLPQKKVMVKREKQILMPSSDIPSTKRQRTDAGPSTSSLTITPPSGNAVSSPVTDGQAVVQEQRPWMQPPVQTSVPPTTSAYQSQSTRVSPVLPNTATLPQRNATPGYLAAQFPVSMPPEAVPSWQHTSKPLPSVEKHRSTYTPYTPGPTPHPIAQNVQQSRVSEPQSYRAPTVTMQASTQFFPESESWLAPKPTAGLSSSAIPSRPTNRGSTAFGLGIGAFAPAHTDQEWEGMIVDKSPEMAPRPPPSNLSTALPAAPPAAASTTPPLAPRTNTKKRKSVTRPTPAQYDGAIDLAGDTEMEEERQNLLSSFKGSSATGRQP